MKLLRSPIRQGHWDIHTTESGSLHSYITGCPYCMINWSFMSFTVVSQFILTLLVRSPEPFLMCLFNASVLSGIAFESVKFTANNRSTSRLPQTNRIRWQTSTHDSMASFFIPFVEIASRCLIMVRGRWIKLRVCSSPEGLWKCFQMTYVLSSRWWGGPAFRLVVVKMFPLECEGGKCPAPFNGIWLNSDSKTSMNGERGIRLCTHWSLLHTEVPCPRNIQGHRRVVWID